MSIVFITGAGISIASGIPPFNGKGGIYSNLKYSPQDIISEEGVTKYPDLFWETFKPLYEKEYKPNCNHAVISAICNKFIKHAVITQNIDCLHNKYNDKDNIIELHGNNQYIKCMNCSTKREPVFDKIPDPCGKCRQPMRPDVVLFKESLGTHMYSKIMCHAKRCNYIVTVGTQSTYPYILQMINSAKQRGAVYIDINPETTDLSHMARYHIQETAEVGLIILEKKYLFPVDLGIDLSTQVAKSGDKSDKDLSTLDTEFQRAGIS